MIDILYLMENYYPKELKKILNKRNSDIDEINILSQKIITMNMVGVDPENNIESIKGISNIKLNSKEKKALLSILKEMYCILPIWIYHGFSLLEIISEEETREGRINELTANISASNFLNPLEDAYDYIYTYLTINGAMDVNKLIEILKTHHNIYLEKEDILDIIKDDDYIKITGKYINIIDNDLKQIEKLMKQKNLQKEYKIIDDPEKTQEEFDKNYDKLEEILESYKLNEKASDIIISLSIMGTLNSEMIKATLNYFGNNLPNKKVENLAKELNNVIKNNYSWKLNGFKPSEKNYNRERKTKIGRNEKCICGSGLKYKHCCGK